MEETWLWAWRTDKSLPDGHVETFQEQTPGMCKLWHQRLACLGGIKPLLVECAVVRVGGKGGRTDTEVLVRPARTLERIPGAVGVLEELGKRIAGS